MSDPHSPAPAIAVGLISASALAYEILLTRVFAIVHWHHLVATAIGLALLGYGASGSFLAVLRRPLERHFALAFIGNALLFGLSALLCVGLAQRLPFDPQALAWDPAQIAYLAGTFLILTLPFFAAANCVGLALMHFPATIPRLYGFDLLGAGLGAVTVLGGLMLAHPGDALFGVFLGGMLVAVVAAWTIRWHPVRVIAVVLCLSAAVWVWERPEIRPAIYKDLSRTLSVIGAVVEAETHGPAGTVTVVGNDTVPIRLAPGLSLQSAALPPRQRAVFVDGDGVGTLTDFRAGRTAMAYLAELTSAIPYQLLDAPRVAVLNAGIGTAVQQAIHLGASRVVAVESNPLLQELRCTRYPELSGGACTDPKVQWHIQSPRAFLAQQQDPFDLISLGLSVDPAGLDALNVDFDPTVQALEAYLRHLSPGGLLAIEGPSRVPPRLSLRLLDTARSALQHHGVVSPHEHVAMIRGWQRFTLLVARQPFEQRALAELRHFAEARGFDLVWLPGMQPADANRFQRLSEPSFYLGAVAILAPDGRPGSLQSRFRLQPASDSRPFPYRFTRWSDGVDAVLRGDSSGLSQVDLGLLVAAVTLILVTLIGGLLILLPLAWLRRDPDTDLAGHLRHRTLAYFGLIGFAFLFIEIGWIHRLQLFLGHPVYATTSVLAAFLVFAGLGSLWSQRRASRAHRLLPAAVVAIALFSLVYLLILPPVQEWAAALPLMLRAAIVLLLLAPLAFAMGIPFPLGLRGLGRSSAGLVPWAWGINGCTSVVGAVATPLLAAEIGFGGLMALASAAYLALPALRLHLPAAPVSGSSHGSI